MACLNRLPYPHLQRHTVEGISFLTDGALASSVGVYAGFTLRQGGVSVAPYDSLNLATHVNDVPDQVHQNRGKLLAALGFSSAHLFVPNQIHGTELVTIDDVSEDAERAYRQRLHAGADGIIVNAPETCALLCFADCLPAIVVSPTGRYAVLHAGWRGALAGIVGKAIEEMTHQDASDNGTAQIQQSQQANQTQHSCQARQSLPEFELKSFAAEYNLYIGPHICGSCFEVSAQIAQQFEAAYGSGVLLDKQHVSLAAAVRTDALRAGVDPTRIAQTDLCTVCNNDQLFSYRASAGVCGRQGAFGIRRQCNERRKKLSYNSCRG